MAPAQRGNSPLVEECIVFGDGKPQIGCLILPSQQAADLAKDKTAYLDAIWHVIAEANSRSPSHSVILPEMVDILPVGTEIPVATKLSILRPACYKKFAPIIDAIYGRYETGSGQAKKDINDQVEMEAFLRETISDSIGPKGSGLTKNTDLFAFGVDSLQAMKIRNIISRSLELGVEPLGQNIVYENPSVARLATYLLAFKTGGAESASAESVQREMLQMVERWSAKVDPVSKAINGTANGNSKDPSRVFVSTDCDIECRPRL